MKLKLIVGDKGIKFSDVYIGKLFFPIEITKSFLFIKRKSIAYPTNQSYKIYDDSIYVKYIDKNGVEYGVTKCLEFTDFTVLEQTFDVKEIEEMF